MRVGLLAPPFERVPPRGYGGTERVVAFLADALAARGHAVTLFASADSETAARLSPIAEAPVWHDPRYHDDAPFQVLAAARAYARAGDLDVMHNHMDFAAWPHARHAPIPTLTTLHWRLDPPELQPLYAEYREQALVSVSDAQRAPFPDARWMATVYHGYPRDHYHARLDRGRYLVFCGRCAPEKGLDRAIAVALATGVPLKIAAPRPPENPRHPVLRDQWDHYQRVLVPYLDHPLIDYLGEVSDREKQELYGGAMALLFPIDWPEPFGLVMIEALACGTPVLAMPRGAAPEVVRNGETGFLCRSVDELVAAVARVERLDRAECRRDVERRFTSEAMAAGYERAYDRLLAEDAQRRAATARVIRVGVDATNGGAPTGAVASHDAGAPGLTEDGAAAKARAQEAPRRVTPERWARFERSIAEIFEAMGMRFDRPGTWGTPSRFLRALFEATDGYEGDGNLVTTFTAETTGRTRDAGWDAGQVVEGPIPIFALCEHHALPFFGRAWVGYVPAERRVDLSGLTRLVRRFARRFTVQERVGEDVAAALDGIASTRGVAVHLDAVHLCNRMRGSRETAARMRTTAWRGAYTADEHLRAGFRAMVRASGASDPGRQAPAA